MTTAEPSRLDRIERILEQQQQQFAQFQQQQQAAAERIDRQLDNLAANQTEERDRRLEFREELETLFQSVQQTDRTVAQLTADVGELRITIESVAQEAQQDRSQAAVDRAEFRSTVTQLLEVLTRQFNGNGRGGE